MKSGRQQIIPMLMGRPLRNVFCAKDRDCRMKKVKDEAKVFKVREVGIRKSDRLKYLSFVCCGLTLVRNESILPAAAVWPMKSKERRSTPPDQSVRQHCRSMEN